ncbi:MAG TPA: carbonic anhydrase [Candidatus Competibacteraceae bacterium]|nr:carbonic anhydrase [Candidatus Competibacteraceae bacterium]
MQDLQKFIAGFCRFQENYLAEDGLFSTLREGQQPTTLLIGCCDSRVDPALLTGCDPGDIFVVRNVANLVPPCVDDGHFHGTSAGIEFAVCGLQVQRIIVLGHARCGGIRALLEPRRLNDDTDFLGHWMRFAAPARDQVLHELAHKSPEQRQRACEQATILLSLDNLLTYPWVRRRVEAGQLILHGWYFDIDAGALLAYSPRRQEFLPVVCPLERPARPRAA